MTKGSAEQIVSSNAAERRLLANLLGMALRYGKDLLDVGVLNNDQIRVWQELQIELKLMIEALGGSDTR